MQFLLTLLPSGTFASRFLIRYSIFSLVHKSSSRQLVDASLFCLFKGGTTWFQHFEKNNICFVLVGNGFEFRYLPVMEFMFY